MAPARPAAALIICPGCGQRHVVRVDEPPVQLECGGRAQVSTEHGRPVARFWGAGADAQSSRTAMVVTITEA